LTNIKTPLIASKVHCLILVVITILSKRCRRYCYN